MLRPGELQSAAPSRAISRTSPYSPLARLAVLSASVISATPSSARALAEGTAVVGEHVALVVAPLADVGGARLENDLTGSGRCAGCGGWPRHRAVVPRTSGSHGAAARRSVPAQDRTACGCASTAGPWSPSKASTMRTGESEASASARSAPAISVATRQENCIAPVALARRAAAGGTCSPRPRLAR